MPETLTTKQVARVLSCSPYTVRELCQAGRLPAIKLKAGVKSHWRVKPADLKAFIKRQNAKRQTGKR